MGGIWWLVLLVLVLVLGSVSGRVSGGVRRRASEEGRVKSELCPDPTLAPMSVFIGLKTTTASSSYTARTRMVLSSWGTHSLGNLALITDGIITRHNLELAMTYSNLPIIEMIGSEKFGQYRQGPAHRHTGYASQRIKVRSLIKWFHTSLLPHSNIEWLCYIDDDMYVNPYLLNEELTRIMASLPLTCSRSDRCVVADSGPIDIGNGRVYNYSNAIWCMTIPTVRAVHDVLQSSTDEELGWSGSEGSDDVGFAVMMKRQLNISFSDSLSMFSINNRVAVDPPDRFTNVPGSYKIHKVNIRGGAAFDALANHKAASDVLSRIAVLNLPHVNYTDLQVRHGAHSLPPNSNPRVIVDMKQWNAYVNPPISCRKPLNETLRIPTGALATNSFILKYK